MVTKIGAAEKQLDTAIKLFFENVDHLSAYTLAAASSEITDDLCGRRENELFLSELERVGDAKKVRLSFRYEMGILVKSEYLKHAMDLIRKPQNFLKHADKDPNGQMEEISVEKLALCIVFAIKNFVLLEKRWTPAMSLFFCWFAAKNPQYLLKDRNDDFEHQIMNITKEIYNLEGEQAFHRFYEGLKQNAPYLFPQKSS